MRAPIDVVSLLLPDVYPVVLRTAAPAGAVHAEFAAPALLALAPTSEVGPDGRTFPVDWGTPGGAEAVEVDPVTVTISGDVDASYRGFPLGELITKVDDTEVVVTVPAGRRIRALHLANLVAADYPSRVLRHERDLKGSSYHLTVSLPDPAGGWVTPVVAVPAVGPRGQIPATLTGASFANSVLRLPDLAGTKLRICLVTKDTPEEFEPVELKVGTVTGWASTIPTDLALTGPDGTTLWAFPGDLPPSGPAVTADVTVGVAAALEGKRAAGQPLTGELTLKAAHPARVVVTVSPVTGALLRRIPGTTSTVLQGEPETIAVPGTPLPGTPPDTVIVDLHVTYAGKRLADLSDPLPPAGSQSGTVVLDQPVFRAYPPAALRGERVIRIGLVGFCPEASALLVRLVRGAAAAGRVGSAGPVTALGQPGVATVPASGRPDVVWVDLPEPVTVDQAVAIEVSAGKGRFLWVGDPDPLVRVVVLDPSPGNRPVVLGSAATAPSTLFTVQDPELTVVRAALPPAAFTGGSLVLASALFCTVELTDVELRYRRGTGA